MVAVNATQTVDLRSDTVTRPTAAMREAMMAALVGDDTLGDDPTVSALEERVASLLHKDAALFVPSGVMANQLALYTQTRHGDEIITLQQAHIADNEVGAPAALSGLSVRSIPVRDACFDIDAVQGAFRPRDTGRFPGTSLVALENTWNAGGGVVLDQPCVLRMAALARRLGLAMHLDGARLFNAAVASRRSVGELAAPFDTVSICLSKGLGCPVGSVLVGPAATIRAARHFRRMLGGSMRQAGILAAAGVYALDHHVDRLVDDHRRAEAIAVALAEMPGVDIDPGRVHTNIVYFGFEPGHPFARAPESDESGLIAQLAQNGLLISGDAPRYRALTHLDVDDDGVERSLAALHSVLVRA